jgi:HAD superfamily 5'-nucleotidase-like hydrolase
MDYTLIQYRTHQWEERAYECAKRQLEKRGWPVAELRFDIDLVIPGLAIDTELGNIVKPNRFGYIKRACHGTQMLDFDTQRRTYSRVHVEPEVSRWVPLNTLFSLSRACIYAQLVDLLEANALSGVKGYLELYRIVTASLDQAHMEGELKEEIAADPARFVELDQELPQTLVDLKQAGKKLLLITNAEWPYTQAMMSFAFDHMLPSATTWRELFDLIFVSARKPYFFSQRNPVFEVVEQSGLLRPVVGPVRDGRVYLGGSAGLVEDQLELSGDEILYVGDHILTDVHASKTLLRWRTALVVPELETELAALAAFAPDQAAIDELMATKEQKEQEQANLRLQLQRRSGKPATEQERSTKQLRRDLDAVRAELVELVRLISPFPHRQRQEPPGAPDRNPRRHLHGEGLAPLRLYTFCLPALPPRLAPPRRGSLINGRVVPPIALY